jgi:hypothetical protein
MSWVTSPGSRAEVSCTTRTASALSMPWPEQGDDLVPVHFV